MKHTRFRGMTGRERIVALVPDRQVSYAYVTGIFKPYMRDGTSIHWHSTYFSRFAGSGLLPRRSLKAFLQKCADGLAAAVVSQPARWLRRARHTVRPDSPIPATHDEHS